MTDKAESSIRFCAVAPAIEFACWVVALLAPVLRLINGPAVTSDQFVIQVSLFGLALVGGIGLRAYQLLHR
jgi:hypothetical protein